MALWRCLTLIDYKGSLDHYFKWTFQWHAVMAEINMTNRELDDCGIGITDLEFSKLLNVWMTFQKLTTNVCMCFHSWEKYWIAFFLENYTVFNNELGGRREKKKKRYAFFHTNICCQSQCCNQSFYKFWSQSYGAIQTIDKHTFLYDDYFLVYEKQNCIQYMLGYFETHNKYKFFSEFIVSLILERSSQR